MPDEFEPAKIVKKGFGAIRDIPNKVRGMMGTRPQAAEPDDRLNRVTAEYARKYPEKVKGKRVIDDRPTTRTTVRRGSRGSSR